ncbi:MAG TPA: hypothetical protein IGR64_17835 [Leptolyngbyaceae cyanobacterium M65_K2018_010]|nr:hypothetical protein [Leptolyngbyaceae cyanobacterium M65_K2018_010]
MNPAAQLGPLNPGDVVSAALRLYRDRFKTYLKLSALATLWLLGGLVGLVLLIALPVAMLSTLGSSFLPIIGGLGGLVLGFLALLYGSAKYYQLSGVMGRLVFCDLVNRPETASAAQRLLAPKLGQFLWLGFLLFLAYMAAYLAASLGALIAGGAVGLLIAGMFTALINGTVGGILGGILGLMLGLGVFVLVLIWILARLFIADAVLAIEASQDAGGSLSRSWELTQTSVWRIQIVFLAAFLIQLPILMVTNYFPSLFFAFLPDNTAVLAASQGIGLLLSLLGSVLTLPLWQAVKAVLYYDLRSRREGLDLELRHPPEQTNP